MTVVQIYSEAFASAELKDPFVVRPSQDIWEKWQRENFHASRIFLRIQHPFDEGEEFYCSVGDPIYSESPNTLYLPMWMIDSNRYQGCGEEAEVNVFTPDELPKATRIVLKPVDSKIHEVDVVQALEKPFSSIGVLQQGKTYLIPLDELHGYQVPIFVERLEPADVVFLDGDEIPLEFVEAVDHRPPPPPRVPTPPPEPLPVLLPTNGNMIPNDLVEAFSPNNRVVLPDASRQWRSMQNTCPPGFVPFSGRGYRLDGGS